MFARYDKNEFLVCKRHNWSHGKQIPGTDQEMNLMPVFSTASRSQECETNPRNRKHRIYAGGIQEKGWEKKKKMNPNWGEKFCMNYVQQ